VPIDILAESLARDLVEAASRGDVVEVRRLLDVGVAPTVRPSEFMHGPLHFAACRADLDIVRELLDRGCPADAPDAMGTTALGLVVHQLGERPSPGETRRLETVVELLLAHGASPTAGPGREHTPLVLARRYELKKLEDRFAAQGRPWR
jgi:hypothetical protein